MKQKRFFLTLAAIFIFAMIGLAGNQIVIADDKGSDGTIDQLMMLIGQFAEEGAFSNSTAPRALTTHLTAIKHYEQQGDTDKAIQHMQNFHVLIDHQVDNGLLTSDAYQQLGEQADLVLDLLQGKDQERLPIVSNGQAFAVIVKPEQSGSEINEAATAISAYIERSTGVKLPVYTVDELEDVELEPSTVMIQIGEGSYSADVAFIEEVQSLHDDGFIVAPNGHQLIITGSSPVGTRNGAYAFLEKYVGVTWLFPGEEWTDVPQKNELLMPEKRWTEEPTAFTLRRTMNMSEKYYGNIRRAWLRQNRTISASEIKIGHNIFNIFPVEKYGDTEKYPNFYPNNNPPAPGNHAGWQPCYSNPATVDVAIEHIKQYFANHPNEISFSLAVNDTDGFCEMNPDHPGYPENPKVNSVGRMHMSEIYYQWVNDVVEGVTEEYPDKWFALYAYHAVIDPPEFDLHPRVIPVVTKDRLSWVDPDVEAQGKAHFDAWREKAQVLGWYDYMLGSIYSAPRVYPHHVSDLYEYAIEQNVQLHHWDMHPVLGDGPQPWVIAKLGWSMEKDVDTLLDHWYETAVGPEAAADLKAYYELWEQFWHTKARQSSWFELSKYQTYLSLRNSSYLAYAKDEIVQSRQLLESVVAKAQTAEQKIRAGQLLQQFEYYEASVLSYPRELEMPENDAEALSILNELEQTLEERLYLAKHRLELIDQFSHTPALKYPLDPTTYNETWSGWSSDEFWHIQSYLKQCELCGENSELAQMLRSFQNNVSKPKLRQFAHLLDEIDIHRSLAEDASFEESGIPTWNKWNPAGSAVIDVTNEQSFNGEDSLRFNNATLAGVWKFVDVQPGLLASNVQFYTPAGTTSDGEVQIVIELHTGEDKLVYYSDAMRLADHAGEWTEITFFEDMPEQINGRDIQSILINTQIRNAADAIVYLDDVGVYQVQKEVTDLIDVLDQFVEVGKLTSAQAETMRTLLETADEHLQENEVERYVGLLADFIDELRQLHADEVLDEINYEFLVNEASKLIHEYVAFTVQEQTLHTSHSGTIQVPVSIVNHHSEDLTFELTSHTSNEIQIDFAHPVIVPANQSVTVEGILTIPVDLPEEAHHLTIDLGLGDKHVLSETLLIIHNRNVLVNPGFEELEGSQIVAWQAMNNGLATGEVSVTPDVYSGVNALKLTRDATSGDARVKQMVSVIGGETYELSAWLKSDVTAPGRVQMKVEFYQDVTGIEGYVADVNSPAYGSLEDWEEVSMSFEIPEEANLAVVHLRVYGPGTAYFDDVSFEKVEQIVDPNVLINPGFEELEGSQIVGWQAMNNGLATGEVSVTQDVYSGANALKLMKEDTSRDARVKQLVEVIGGETYELSAWLKSEVTAPGRVQMKVEFYQDVTGVEGYVADVNSPSYGRLEDWEKVNMSFEIPEEANLAVVHLRVYGPGTAYFDDVFMGIVK